MDDIIHFNHFTINDEECLQNNLVPFTTNIVAPINSLSFTSLFLELIIQKSSSSC